MISGALTKGGLSRDPLLALWRTGMLTVTGDTPKAFQEAVGDAATSSKGDAAKA